MYVIIMQKTCPLLHTLKIYVHELCTNYPKLFMHKNKHLSVSVNVNPKNISLMIHVYSNKITILWQILMLSCIPKDALLSDDWNTRKREAKSSKTIIWHNFMAVVAIKQKIIKRERANVCIK